VIAAVVVVAAAGVGETRASGASRRVIRCASGRRRRTISPAFGHRQHGPAMVYPRSQAARL